MQVTFSASSPHSVFQVTCLRWMCITWRLPLTVVFLSRFITLSPCEPDQSC